MKSRRSFCKKVLSLFVIASMVVSLTVSGGPVMAEKASPSVLASIQALLTSTVPNIVEVKTSTPTVTFTHPGIGMTKAMLDNMQNHVRAGDEPWASAFLTFSNYGQSSKTPGIRFVEGDPDYINVPKGGQGSKGFTVVNNMERDGDTAISQAIMWYITGNEVYRQNAMKIIRLWVQLQSVEWGVYDAHIRVSLGVFKLSYAAEILRYSTTSTPALNWSAQDTANMLHMFDVTKYIYDTYTHFMNQHTFVQMGAMAAAIFRNDAQLYATAVKRTTTNPELGDITQIGSDPNSHATDGSIMGQIRAVTRNPATGATINPPNIQVIEMGRDQPHAYDDIYGLSMLALVTLTQGTKVDPVQGTITAAQNGVNLFNFLDHRILAGANYVAKYNLGHAVTYIPGYYTGLSTSGRGRLDAGLGIVYSYYKYIEPRSDFETNEGSKYVAQAYNSIYPGSTAEATRGNGVLLYTTAPTTRLQSHNFTDRYVRHSHYRVQIDPNVAPAADARFRMVAGLADSKGFSFESVNFPGRYLSVRSDGTVWLDTYANTAAFKNNATFRRVPGLANSSKYSYQMWTDPTQYLRHSNYLIYAQSGSGSTFNADATFAEVAP